MSNLFIWHLVNLRVGTSSVENKNKKVHLYLSYRLLNLNIENNK
jgi:hypothetical protein